MKAHNTSMGVRPMMASLSSVNWQKFGERFGVPTLFATILLAGIWTIVGWTANNVAVPLANRHMRFLDSLERRVNEDSASRALFFQSVAEVQRSSDRTQELLVQNQALMVELTQTVARLAKAIELEHSDGRGKAAAN